MGLDDPEDNPPLEPSSIPPEPIESFREPADTEPAAAPDIVAQLVDGLKPAFAHLEGLIAGLATDVTELKSQVSALDVGVGAALAQSTENGEKLDTITTRTVELANGLLAVSADVQDLRTSVTEQFDHDGAKRRELEQSVADLQESSEQRLSATGG